MDTATTLENRSENEKADCRGWENTETKNRTVHTQLLLNPREQTKKKLNKLKRFQ